MYSSFRMGKSLGFCSGRVQLLQKTSPVCQTCEVSSPLFLCPRPTAAAQYLKALRAGCLSPVRGLHALRRGFIPSRTNPLRYRLAAPSPFPVSIFMLPSQIRARAVRCLINKLPAPIHINADHIACLSQRVGLYPRVMKIATWGEYFTVGIVSPQD